MIITIGPGKRVRSITEHFGWLRPLTRGQLTGPSLDSLFTKTTTICLMITRQVSTKASNDCWLLKSYMQLIDRILGFS